MMDCEWLSSQQLLDTLGNNQKSIWARFEVVLPPAVRYSDADSQRIAFQRVHTAEPSLLPVLFTDQVKLAAGILGTQLIAIHGCILTGVSWGEQHGSIVSRYYDHAAPKED